jgi:hypothetical protein
MFFRILLVVFVVGVFAGCSYEERYEPQNGDLVFHESTSRQSEAIRILTGSRYTHMGIVYVDRKRAYVYEAVQPVKATPLDAWIARGKDGHFVAKRLADAPDVLTPGTVAEMKKVGDRFRGRDYDLQFLWSDDRLYCSELVWKIYRRGAGVQIGKPQVFGDFDTSDSRVRDLVEKRFEGGIPEEEAVITPAAMFHSDRLETVFSN